MKKVFIGMAGAIVVLLILILILGVLGLGFIRNDFGAATEQFSANTKVSEVYESERHSDAAIGSVKSGGSPQTVTREASGTSQPTPSVPDAMYFQDYGVNIFKKTINDSRSTFGLDVDTASYTIAKNYIMRGSLPPTDAIRPEEFINYHDYKYENPEGDFSIISDVTPSPFDEGIHYLRIGIKSHEIENRSPATLTFVVDVSGSMNRENRLGLVKRTMRYLVSQLSEEDTICMVTYNTNAQKALECTRDRQKIETAIGNLEAGGSTNADAGLRLGYQLASENFNREKNNRVVLLSDGVANVGTTDPEAMIHKLQEYYDQGIMISAIGVGMGNYNDELLEKIADKGNGNYYYVNDFMEARRVFNQQLSGTLEAVAKDAKVQVEFNPESVQEYRLIGYENRKIADDQFRNDSKDAGEIGAGHQVTAIYELKLTGTEDLGTIYLRYKNKQDLAQETSHLIQHEVTEFAEASDRLKLAVATARFAMILKLAAPPPSITKVHEITSSIEPLSEPESSFIDVVSNAKGLIDQKVKE
ncbi:MAG: vWA domain-containing protein [Nanobdellota archaeon]